MKGRRGKGEGGKRRADGGEAKRRVEREGEATVWT